MEQGGAIVSELPFNLGNAYRISFGEVTDAKLSKIDIERKVVEFTTQSKGAEGEMRAISLSDLDAVLASIVFTAKYKKWQPSPFNSHDLPTRWHLHRKRLTSLN